MAIPGLEYSFTVRSCTSKGGAPSQSSSAVSIASWLSFARKGANSRRYPATATTMIAIPARISIRIALFLSRILCCLLFLTLLLLCGARLLPVLILITAGNIPAYHL